MLFWVFTILSYFINFFKPDEFGVGVNPKEADAKISKLGVVEFGVEEFGVNLEEADAKISNFELTLTTGTTWFGRNRDNTSIWESSSKSGF